jgi:hypothetical protein
VDHAFDVLVTLIILALGLAVFFGCLKVIENPVGYGIGTLDEKSTRPAPEQLKRVSQITYFSKAHALLLPAVDCGMNTENTNRFITIEGTGSFSYDLKDLSLNIGDRLADVVGQIGTNTSIDGQRNYRLGITVNGDLILNQPGAPLAGENQQRQEAENWRHFQ